MLINNNTTILFGDNDRLDVQEHINDIARIFLAKGEKLYKAVNWLYLSAGAWDVANILKEAVPSVKEVFNYYEKTRKVYIKKLDAHKLADRAYAEAAEALDILADQLNNYIIVFIDLLNFLKHQKTEDITFNLADVEKSYSLRALETGHGKATPYEILVDDLMNVHSCSKDDVIKILAQKVSKEEIAEIINLINE
jgi:hypothetical protein